MTQRRTVFGLNPEKVHQFLDDCVAPGSPQDAGKGPVDMEQLLQEQLSEKCPVVVPGGQSQSWLLDRMQQTMFLGSSRSVGEVLTDPQAGLDILRDIKEHYKERAENAAGKAERHVWTAVYFAAVARALVSHGRRITQHPTNYLVRSFQDLAGTPWIGPALSELYRRAQQACEHST